MQKKYKIILIFSFRLEKSLGTIFIFEYLTIFLFNELSILL